MKGDVMVGCMILGLVNITYGFIIATFFVEMTGAEKAIYALVTGYGLLSLATALK